MADIAVDHLLAAIRDALTLPRPAVPKAHLAYLKLARGRSVAVCRAVDHAWTSGDLTRATDMVDEAINTLPVAYPTKSLDVGVPR